MSIAAVLLPRENSDAEALGTRAKYLDSVTKSFFSEKGLDERVVFALHCIMCRRASKM